MKTQFLDRRGFIKNTGTGLIGLSAAGYTSLARGFGASGISASEKLVIGMIGVGGMGMNRLNGFLEHEDVEIGAICDVDTRHIDQAMAVVKEKRRVTPRTTADFRHVLDMQDIDAIAVVTPDHWHSLILVRGCEAGKDVFVEKPLSYSIAEGRAMVDAADRHRRVTQMGNHMHNDSSNYRRVVERIQSGQIGKVTRVHLWKAANTENREFVPASAPPPELDYEMWQGPAPRRPYHPLRSHSTWRNFWVYSGGEFIDFWCHISDVAFWALDLKAPTTVSAIGGKYYLDGPTETPDTFEAQLAFPELNYIFRLHGRPMPGLEHIGWIGAVFEGTEGTLATNYTRHEVYIDGKKVEDLPEPSVHIPDSPGHLREFIDAVKTRNLDTTCNVRYGHRLTKPALLANIAYRTGSTLHWDDVREEIVGNPEANRLLRRDFHEPWSL